MHQPICDLYFDHPNDPKATAHSIRDRLIYQLLVSQNMSLADAEKIISDIAKELAQPLNLTATSNGDSSPTMQAIKAAIRDNPGGQYTKLTYDDIECTVPTK